MPDQRARVPAALRVKGHYDAGTGGREGRDSTDQRDGVPTNHGGGVINQRRSLFDSMSNHIANSMNCEPEISSSATSTTVPTLIALPLMPQHELDDPEREPERAS